MKAKTKKQLKHLLTRKKLLRKHHAKHLSRGLFVVVATACTSSLAFAIATTKPTVNIQVAPRTTTKVTDIAPAASTNLGQPDQSGQASWYALGLPEPDSLTCASTTFPRGTYLKVTNRRNQKTVVCRVNDYGPEAWTKRVIDLSRGSFRAIESLGSGTTPVDIWEVPPPPTSLNLPLASSKFGQFVGYRLCRQNNTAQFCEANRQKQR